tara:strand:+ start:10591 stop:11091 length:501 start_codon:yes stop_codon:yes gene_type:complete
MSNRYLSKESFNNHLSRLNGVKLLYILDKYDRGTFDILIDKSETILKSIGISLLGAQEIEENFHEIDALFNITFKNGDTFEIHPDLLDDENEHYGQIYFENLENYNFQGIESPIKEKIFKREIVETESWVGPPKKEEKDVLIGTGKLYYDIFWNAIEKAVWAPKKR